MQISDLALKRDKARAGEELKNYFINKNRQEQSWQLTNALVSSLRKKAFSNAEAGKITSFLSREFDIRHSALQYSQAWHLGPRRSYSRVDNIRSMPLRTKENTGLFYDIYLRLQAAVQDKLLDYRGAHSLVKEIVYAYPASRAHIGR